MARPISRENITVRSVPFGVVRRFRDLADIDLTNLYDRSILMYNALTQKFESVTANELLDGIEINISIDSGLY
jgi:hypothetical protein